MESNYHDYFRKIEASVDTSLGAIVTELDRCEIHPDEDIQNILKATQELQQKVGYNGNYKQWVDKWRPVRLEDTL